METGDPIMRRLLTRSSNLVDVPAGLAHRESSAGLRAGEQQLRSTEGKIGETDCGAYSEPHPQGRPGDCDGTGCPKSA